MEKYLKKYYQLFFLAVAILLLYPTLQRGYIMLLDWSIWPFVSLVDIKTVDPLGWALYKFFALIFTPAVFQRIFLFGAIVLLGLAGFRLAKKTGNLAAQYFSGLLLIFNPFIYARLVEQTMIVGGGSIAFFWFLVYFLEYLDERKTKKLVIASVLAALAISFFAHSIFFIGAAFVSLLAFDYFQKKDWKFILKSGLILWSIIVILNLNWAITSLKENDTTWASNVKNFTQADLNAFETSGINGESVYLSVIALQGYWGEYQNQFVTISENPLWRIAFLLIFVLVVFGTVNLWRKDRSVKPLVVLFWIAFILAIGVASPLFKPLALWLYQNVPLYIGLREPQKWVAVMVFVYAYLGSWGIKYLLEMKQLKNFRLEVGIFCVALPIIFSFSAIQGMHEHFTPREFPAEWQEAKKYLSENPTDGKILFLPWHSYLEYDFAGKNILNPAKAYFGRNIVSGNNIEFGKVYSNFSDPQTKAIQKYVVERGNFSMFKEDMKNLGIDRIILAKTEDWQEYAWLDTIGLRKELMNAKIIIYKLP